MLCFQLVFSEKIPIETTWQVCGFEINKTGHQQSPPVQHQGNFPGDSNTSTNVSGYNHEKSEIELREFNFVKKMERQLNWYQVEELIKLTTDDW